MKVAIREVATGQVTHHWPVDAREILRMQPDAFEPADVGAERIAGGEAAVPMQGPVQTTLATSGATLTAPTAKPRGQKGKEAE